MLDTNICIAIINRDERVRPHLERHTPSRLRVSAITIAELRFGIAKSKQSKRAAQNVALLLSKVRTLPFDEAATHTYGVLRESLERKGVPIGPLDTLIAAHALAAGCTLATNNTREFRRAQGLQIEDWLAPIG
jgi:tRNA(fMet)-specific endonuclease VapC